MIAEIVALAMHKIDRSHDHARRTEAALQPVMLAEGFLHRMQRRAVGGKPLNGPDLMPVRHHRQRCAGLNGLAVEMDHTRRTAGVAADMRAGQPKILTQELNEQRVRASTLPVTGLPFTISEILAINTLLFSAWRPGFSARGLALKFRGTAWRGQRVFKIVPNS